MTTTYNTMDASHLGDNATEADLAEFRDLCEQVAALHPDWDEQTVTDSVWGDGDYYANARKLGAIVTDGE